MSSRTLLITGASSGLGLALALHALHHGHRVFGTSRDIEHADKEHPEFVEKGGSWLSLDMSQDNSVSLVSELIKTHGIDTIVNNAAYAALGPLEDWSVEEAQAQFAVNVFAPLRLLKAAIPIFRERRSGTIVNMSSTSGLTGLPGTALYAGSKFALEGITESLREELRPFGIRVVLVNPGGFRTRFLSGTSSIRLQTRAYEGSPAGQTVEAMRRMAGNQAGDPEKAAERILEYILGSDVDGEASEDSRLLLGSDCLKRMEVKIASLDQSLRRNSKIAVSTDF